MLEDYTAERLQFLEDIIATAIEGGIGHWSTTVQYQYRLSIWEPIERSVGTKRLQEGTVARVREIDPFEWQRQEGRDYHDITPELIERGILAIATPNRDSAPPNVSWHDRRTIASAWATHSSALDAVDIDVGQADVIVQVAIFGEVRYG